MLKKKDDREFCQITRYIKQESNGNSKVAKVINKIKTSTNAFNYRRTDLWDEGKSEENLQPEAEWGKKLWET